MSGELYSAVQIGTVWSEGRDFHRLPQKALLRPRQLSAAEVREHDLEFVRTDLTSNECLVFNFLCPFSRCFERLVPNKFVFKKRVELRVISLVLRALCFERPVRHTGRTKKVSNAAFEHRIALASVCNAPFATFFYKKKTGFERHVLNLVSPSHRFERPFRNLTRSKQTFNRRVRNVTDLYRNKG